MKTVRDFVQRLSALENKPNPEEQLSVLHRRLLVPEMGRFSLDGTIVRSLPLESVAPYSRPGAPDEVMQVLEWIDLAEQGSDSAFAPNDLAVDLSAILALSTGRRVSFANEVPISLEGAAWTGFLGVGHSVDGEIYGPADPDLKNGFVETVQAIIALPEDKALALGGAIRTRNAACCLIENDHSSAYGLLIVAIETLSRAFGEPPSAWHEWNEAEGWDQLFLNIALDRTQTERLRGRLLENTQIRLRRTFVEYAAEKLDASFWERPYFQYTPEFEIDQAGLRRGKGSWQAGPPLSTLVPMDAPDLRRRLGKSYDARSKVFHESVRLDQVAVSPIPGQRNQPLPFAGLRRILDHLLWQEIHMAAKAGEDLPDVQVIHPAAGSNRP